VKRVKLNNELRILPLRKYEVTYVISVDQSDKITTDVFTADFHRSDTEAGFIRNQFMRTGNVIREYQLPLLRVVVTPADDEEIPA
jgi:hypothetical protein